MMMVMMMMMMMIYGSNLGKLPLVGRVVEGTRADPSSSSSSNSSGDVWVYTGLGGRGLIHHAFLGR